MRIRKMHHFLLHICVLLLPFVFLHNTLLDMVDTLTLSRVMRSLHRILSPIPFMLGTVLLGLIVRASYRWYDNPNRYTFVNMLATTMCLGTVLLYALHMALYFHMPGDGPIP